MMEGKILVVDDDPDWIFILKTILAREGYEVIGANSGKECLDKIKEIKPNVVLLDIIMPDINGWEVCRRIKEDKDTGYISVSMLSVRDAEEDKKRSIECGADGHIGKPIKFEEVIMTVRELERKTA
jgi:DNA-binding response OmpR family regulator